MSGMPAWRGHSAWLRASREGAGRRPRRRVTPRIIAAASGWSRSALLGWAVVTSSSCARPARSAPLIDAYARAECAAPLVRGKLTRTAREWGSTLSVLSGRKVTVVGAQLAGSVIQVRYGASGKTGIAATVGDYVSPADVRIDRRLERLYVRADGRAGGLVRETVLFEYDIGQRLLLGRLSVDPEVLRRSVHRPGSVWWLGKDAVKLSRSVW